MNLIIQKIAKYKCPKCRLKYCSLECFKIHSSSDECKEEANTKETKNIDTVDEEDQKFLIHEDRLKAIQQSPKLKEMLKSKLIQELITKIVVSKDKLTELELLRKNPEFGEMIDELLIAVGVCRRNSDNNIEFLL